jgi:uridine kinase
MKQKEIDFNSFMLDIKGNINFLEVTPDKKILIGVSGGSGSGKTFISKKIAEKLNAKLLSMDDYIIYEKVKTSKNWDIPEIWDLELLKKHLNEIKKGNDFEKPVYDFSKREEGKMENFKHERIVVVEGNFALHNLFSDLYDFKIFVDASEKVRLERRLGRDVKKRGRTREQILQKWREFVQPMYLRHIEPQKAIADLIVRNG